MSTIRNVVIDDLIRVLSDMKAMPGVTHVDITFSEEDSSIDIHPIVIKTKGRKKPKDPGLNINELPS